MVAALSALIWYAWLGRDRQYQVDAVTGVHSGPYEAWQVAGCAGSLLVLLLAALLAGVWAPPAGASLTLAFTAAWTVDAASRDDTGLFGVGTFLLVIGLAMASTVMWGAMSIMRSHWWRRRTGRPQRGGSPGPGPARSS